MRYFKRLYFLILLLVAILSFRTNAQETLLPDTTWVCLADSVKLDAGPGFLSYFWENTLEQTQTIWVKENGLFIVQCDTAESAPPVVDSTWVNFQRAKIMQEDTIITCYGHLYPVTLCVDVDTLKYLWTCSDPDYTIENDTAFCVEVIPESDTTTFYVSISDSLNFMTCVDSVKVFLYPRIKFDTVTQINMGCPGTCKGQLEVLVSGGLPPYSYRWATAPPQFDSIGFGLCEAKYKFTVYDKYICIRDTMLDVEVFDMPDVKINFDPETVYIKNPVVTFTFENNSADSIQIIDWNWNFGDSTYSTQEAPVKVFEDVRVYNVWLKYTTSDECIDSVKIDVDVKPVKLGIPNVFTPNGDEYNQVFEIKELENYMSNEIMIFNRYGKKVFSQTNYQSDWDGDNVKEGVYFYVLKADGYFGTDTYRGSVTIIRRQ